MELDPPIDSANATAVNWQTIARVLYEHRTGHTGFVVLHGTDTMAYTSSALSFLLPSFGRPVVVTGSQIPIARTRSDGRQNLIGALQVAAHADVQEATLLFGEVLLRGNRATKVDASGLDAFESPRFPELASLGIDIVVNRRVIRRPDGEPGLNAGRLGEAAAVRLFPGFSASILANLCRPPLQGLVIEAYGAGNGPSEDREFLRAIETATADGIVVVGSPVRPRVGAPRGICDRLCIDASGRGAGLRHDMRSCPDEAVGSAELGPRHLGRDRIDAARRRRRADQVAPP